MTVPGHIPTPDDADRLQIPEYVRIRAAALRAGRRYPGPLGELVQRELIAFAEFGHRFAADSLVPRLVAALLADPPADAA